MNQIEKLYITSKLVNALQEAANVVTPEERYAIYQESMRLIAVLLKNSKPLSIYREELFPDVTFLESANGLDVFPPDNANMSRVEAIDWRNRLLAEGLGQLTLFRVRYSNGGYVEFAGETEESNAYDRIVLEYTESWKVFRTERTGPINLRRRLAVDNVPTDPPTEPTIDQRIAEAEQQAENLSKLLKSRYPFEVVIVRIPLREPIGTLTEIRSVKR